MLFLLSTSRFGWRDKVRYCQLHKSLIEPSVKHGANAGYRPASPSGSLPAGGFQSVPPIVRFQSKQAQKTAHFGWRIIGMSQDRACEIGCCRSNLLGPAKDPIGRPIAS